MIRNIGQNRGVVADARVETFSGAHTIGSGTLEVQLIDVGPHPHADEIIISYIPSIKTVFVADIFNYRGGAVRAASAYQLALADKLEELQLDVEAFIPVHGVRATADQFWESVRQGRAAQNNN